jgi:benzil reductase ((S)-benzoin forming)
MNLYIVTGTTKGLGKALADALAANAENDVITLSRAPQARQAGQRNYFMELAQTHSIPAIFARAMADCSQQRYERIVLINNAGIVMPVGPLAKCDAAAIATNLQVNLIAPFILMQQFIELTRSMSESRLIINISSGASRRPVAGWSAYCAAKAGIEMVSRVAALEAERGEPGLSVCSLAPGVIDTAMQAQVRSISADEFPDVDRFRAMKAEGALKSADEVADAIIKLERAGAFGNGGVYDIRELLAASEAAVPSTECRPPL